MSKLIDRIGNFTAVPNSVIKLWPAIGVDGIALFLYLRYRTNSETEVAFPSYDTIKKDTTISRNRIAKAIRALESAGVMERKRRFGGSTLYTLKTPISPVAGLMEDSPLVPQQDDSSPVAGRSLVPQQATNKTYINKTESNKKDSDAKKPRHGREINPLEKELTQYFSELTHLKIPEPKTKKDWADAQGAWFKPIAYILDLANGRGRDLVKQTVEKMRADKLTISNPRSIEKVASALYAENYRRYSPNAQTEKEFDPFASLNRYLLEKEQENGEVQNA